MSQQKGAANKALYRSLIASDETWEKCGITQRMDRLIAKNVSDQGTKDV